MMTYDYIIDVTETDFDPQVIEYSRQRPVVVDFWADWCRPCKTFGPIMEKLTKEAHGDFRLARVDVDDNPNLALRFGIRSIPAVKAFLNGAVVAEFAGALPESKLRAFIQKLAPSRADLALEKAYSMYNMEQWEQAQQAFEDVLDEKTNHPKALLGLAKSYIMQGNVEEGRTILENFPTNQEYTIAETIRPLVDALSTVDKEDTLQDNPLDAAYFRSLRLIIRGNIPAAMDGLIEIIRQDKDYREGVARNILLGIFELLGNSNQLTKQYRDELASILF